MRLIKFRAWHTEAKEMVTEKWNGQCLAFLSEGQPVDIMQFTGLLDKNGKEIYEGDIVVGEKWPFMHNVRGVVQYGAIAFAFVGKADNEVEWFFTVTTPDYKQLDDIEVIGNIHENPELLKETGE